MTDKIKIDILKRIQEYRDSKISPELESLEKEGFERGKMRVMVSEGLLNLNGTILSITAQGDKVLRENLIVKTFIKQQEHTLALADSLAKQYKQIQGSMENTLKAANHMQSLANSIKAISFPIRDIQIAMPMIKQMQADSKIFNEIAKTQEWASKLGGLVGMSNLSKLALNIPKMPILQIPLEKITPTIINQFEDELTDLSEDLNDDRDPVYNIEGYEVLFNLEISLRKLIVDRIISKYSKQLPDKIHPEVLKKWEERQAEEKKNKYIDQKDYYLIEYSDFTDLKDIFNKGNNKKLFSDIASEEDFKTILSKLHELNPIRKKIAHSRSLSKREFEVIKMYYDQIIKILSQKKDEQT